MPQHHCGHDIGGGSSFRDGEVSTTTPLVYDNNQSDSRKGRNEGTGSRSRWSSGVSPPEEFGSLTVPLLVQKDSNNSSSSEEENNRPNDDGGGDVTLVPFR